MELVLPRRASGRAAGGSDEPAAAAGRGGQAASHAGQTQLYLTPLHGKLQTIKALIVNIRAALQHVKAIAEQLLRVDRWATLLRYLCQRIAPAITPAPPLNALPATG